MKHKIILFLLIVRIMTPVTAQLSYFGPLNVSNDREYMQHEIAVSVDPSNTNKIVIAAMEEKRLANKNLIHKIRAYHSTDAGRNWRSLEVLPPAGKQFSKAIAWSDPSVAHDHEGRVYVAFNLREGGRGKGLDGNRDAVVVARYRDDLPNREPFYEPVAVTPWIDSDVDKPFLEVDDNPQSPHAGNVYVAWTDLNPEPVGLFIARSSDHGDSWKQESVAPSYPGKIHMVDLGIGPMGEVYAVWLNTENSQVLMKNCGKAISTPNASIKIVSRISDFAKADIKIPAVGEGDIVRPLPSIDVDRSGGPHHGRVWVTFADYPVSRKRVLNHPKAKPGEKTKDVISKYPEQMNIWVTWSDDNGIHWNTPVKVNLDDTKTAQFHPWLDVDDSDGSVGVIYYSAEKDEERNRVVHPVFARYQQGDPGNRDN